MSWFKKKNSAPAKKVLHFPWKTKTTSKAPTRTSHFEKQNSGAPKLHNPSKSPCFESQDEYSQNRTHHLLISTFKKHRPIWKTIVLDISGGAFASTTLETCASQTWTICRCPEWLYLSKMRNRGAMEPAGMLVPSGQVHTNVFILKASEIPLSMHREKRGGLFERAWII